MSGRAQYGVEVFEGCGDALFGAACFQRGDGDEVAPVAAGEGGWVMLRGHSCRTRTTSTSIANTVAVACIANQAIRSSTIPNRPATAWA